MDYFDCVVIILQNVSDWPTDKPTSRDPADLKRIKKDFLVSEKPTPFAIA